MTSKTPLQRPSTHQVFLLDVCAIREKPLHLRHICMFCCRTQLPAPRHLTGLRARASGIGTDGSKGKEGATQENAAPSAEQARGAPLDELLHASDPIKAQPPPSRRGHARALPVKPALLSGLSDHQPPEVCLIRVIAGFSVSYSRHLGNPYGFRRG